MLISFPLFLPQRQMLRPLNELPKWNSILQSFFLPSYPAQFLKDRWIVSFLWEKTFSNSVTLLDWPQGPSKASPPPARFACHFLTHHLCSVNWPIRIPQTSSWHPTSMPLSLLLNFSFVCWKPVHTCRQLTCHLFHKLFLDTSFKHDTTYL